MYLESKILKDEIKEKKEELLKLQSKVKASFDSVKELWGSMYHRSFTDHCEMILCLSQGVKYNPYDFNQTYKIERAKTWQTEIWHDYSNIYEGFGSPIGFISLESGLFEATANKHKKMWMTAIEEKKEERSFEDFKTQLKTDVVFLKESFENILREKGGGVFSTKPYLMEFEEKKLKTGKYYIYVENTSRRL